MRRTIEHCNITSQRLPLDQQRFNPLLAPDDFVNKLELELAQSIYDHISKTTNLKYTDLLFFFSYIHSTDMDTYTNHIVISEISVDIEIHTQKEVEILEIDTDSQTIASFLIAIHSGLNHIKKWDFVYDDDDFGIDRYGEPDEDDDLYFSEKLLELDDPYLESQIIDILDTYGDLVNEKMRNVFQLTLDINSTPIWLEYLYSPFIAEFYERDC